jgi:hypothetical protein
MDARTTPQSSAASCKSAPITTSSSVAPCPITKVATESMGEIGDPGALPDLGQGALASRHGLLETAAHLIEPPGPHDIMELAPG